MQFVRVTRKSENFKDIKRLYKRAFPAEERFPFWLLNKKAHPDRADFWAIYDRDRFLGTAYVVKSESLAYVFYLAIQDGERGKGYGTQVIQNLKARYKDKTLFLALETPDENAPNNAQRIKRHDFYKRCGLTDMPFKIKEGPVIYSAMSAGGDISAEAYRDMMQSYFGKFIFKVIDTRILR